MAGDYEEAERRIAEAKASGARVLSLRGLDIERLPDSLGELTDLEELDLCGCGCVTDIFPVAQLKKLRVFLIGVDFDELGWSTTLERVIDSGH